MAGETPRANKAQQQRRKLSYNDDRSTGKYYASGNPSVVNNTPADTNGRPGEQPQAHANNTAKQDERSADKKYYANPVPPAPTAQQAARARQTPGKAPLPANRQQQPRQKQQPQYAGVPGVYTIREVAHIAPVMRLLPSALTGSAIVIEVPDDKPEVLRRARAALDMLVTREEITEDQARDVRFSKRSFVVKEAAAAPAIDFSKPPEPRGDAVQEDDSLLDPLAVLNGTQSVEENFLDVSADVNAVEAVVTEEPATEEVPTPAAEDDDDDDDGDGFAPPTTQEEPAPAVEEAPQEEAPQLESTSPTFDDAVPANEAEATAQPVTPDPTVTTPGPKAGGRRSRGK
jgi:hypothetical protein